MQKWAKKLDKIKLCTLGLLPPIEQAQEWNAVLKGESSHDDYLIIIAGDC